MEPGPSAMQEAVVGGTTRGAAERAASDASVQPTIELDRDDALDLSPLSAEFPEMLDPWLPGTQVGRYELRECIGSGGLGVVFAGFDPKLGRAVAVKLLRPDRAALPDHRARVLREAQAMAQVRHPNVVEVHDVGETDDATSTVYIVMELLDGISLQEWLARRPSWRAIVAAFVEAARGLAAAHKRGVIHRDFKPTNAMVGTDGRVRVLDFGLARESIAEASTEPVLFRSDDDMLSVELTDADKVLGTPPYMAPEQHVGERIDGRADQYSLCVTLYEGLFGRRPFVGESMRELTDAKLAGRMLPLTGKPVPRALRLVIERGLAPEPRHRFPSMDALASALERVLRRPRWNPLATLGAGATIAAALLAVPAVGEHTPGTVAMATATANTGELASLVEREALAWTLRADVARRAGRLEEALVAANRALELVRALHAADHPASVAGVRRIELLQRELRRRAITGSGTARPAMRAE
jgi:predicted Ser/Thr protein kinase